MVFGNSLFPNRRWLKNPSISEKKEKQQKQQQSFSSSLHRCLSLRGGAAGGNGEQEGNKIQGHCIGIDLGTTYR